MRGLALLAACCLLAVAHADSPTFERRATPAALFPAEQTRGLAKTLEPDTEVHFRVRAPAEATGCGILVYVSPKDSGELPRDWIPELDRHHLFWIAAEGFGNSRPTAERMLAAIMALELARQDCGANTRRRYVAGMSGGGRVASEAIAHFPQLFTGALFIVGANFFQPRDGELSALQARRPLVFLTGSRDFNQREMRSVARQYGKAGVARVLLLDERGFGHQLATPAQLAQALDFLDAG